MNTLPLTIGLMWATYALAQPLPPPSKLANPGWTSAQPPMPPVPESAPSKLANRVGLFSTVLSLKTNVTPILYSVEQNQAKFPRTNYIQNRFEVRSVTAEWLIFDGQIVHNKTNYATNIFQIDRVEPICICTNAVEVKWQVK